MTERIEIKGARSNNLKNIDLVIPKNRMIVFTGVSGSGKSSIVMDTLYAEGQRRYVESLSSYARQFLDRMKKPEVDYIKGICPAIAVEQRVGGGSNARSTVGSMTEIYDYLRILFARIGKTFSPISGKQVSRHYVSTVMDDLQTYEDGDKVFLYIPVDQSYSDRTLETELSMLQQKGFARVRWQDQNYRIDDLLEDESFPKDRVNGSLEEHELLVLIDRIILKKEDQNLLDRFSDSVSTAFAEGKGKCLLSVNEGMLLSYSNLFELDGITFLEPSPQLFNYNNPYGACPRCEGFGRVMGISPAKVIPNPNLSLYEGAVACWSGEKSSKWLDEVIHYATDYDISIHKPYKDLPEDKKALIWNGTSHFRGINAYFDALKEKTYKIQNRIMLARYRGRTVCPECHGGRLRKEASYVKINGKSIEELIHLPLDELKHFFEHVTLDQAEQKIAKRLLREINGRLDAMIHLGLDYLFLDRISGTLSGGETQRIHLTRNISSNLTSSMYILDEPSIGLHPHDTANLTTVLKSLRDLGNTVIVVEHEEDVIRSADHIVDMGPLAGQFGGEVVYNGSYGKLDDAKGSLTADYLFGKKAIELPEIRRKSANEIKVVKAYKNNLQDIDVTFKLNSFNVVSGVSGSGKSTLVRDVLLKGLEHHFGNIGWNEDKGFDRIEGALKMVSGVEFVSQRGIGRSSRSNPVTYIKVYDDIRKLLCKQHLSKLRGYQPKHFSFNVDGGRCETCKGDGENVVEMQFLADVRLQCEDCKGKRFKKEILEVTYNGKNIYDILTMSIVDSLEFFSKHDEIYHKLKKLDDVGLGYLELGQSSSTLSGGEAQRLKLASYLTQDIKGQHLVFIFDEPTTGLHFHDINKLLDSFNALIEKGHTIIVIEHNLDVIKCADWLIDLGPEGGKRGGKLVAQGTPEEVAANTASLTGKFLATKLS